MLMVRLRRLGQWVTHWRHIHDRRSRDAPASDPGRGAEWRRGGEARRQRRGFEAADRPLIGLEPLEPRVLLSADAIGGLVAEDESEREPTEVMVAEPVLASEATEPADAFSPERPLLFVPGIMGTFATTDFVEEWFTTRGIAPELPDPDHDGDGEPDMLPTIEIEPLGGTYHDLVATLENVGYQLNDNFFTVDYDWRLQPGPAPDLDNGEAFDGELNLGGAAGITDDAFRYAVDYMGYYLQQATEAWQSLHGEAPESVDVVTHSTGGLVARAYMQSDAYADIYDDDADLALPEVNNLSMIGVPNRGASKAWNALQDNFASDPQYRMLVSKIGYQAFTLLADSDNGIDQIDGPEGPITLDDVTDSDGNPDGAAFISQYVPTVRSLLATYEFLIAEGDDEPRHINADSEDQAIAQHRNDVLLNLNAGLDVDWSLDEGGGPLDPTENDPSPFLSRLAEGGLAQIVYSADEDTITLAQERTDGTTEGRLPPVVGMDEYWGTHPEVGELWYEDLYLSEVGTVEGGKRNGDGTVPLESAIGQFVPDPRVIAAGEAIDSDTLGILHRIEERGGHDIDHSGMMSNPDVLRIILDQFIGEENYADDDIAQGNGLLPLESLEAIRERGIYDHLSPALEETAPVAEVYEALEWLRDRAADIDDSDPLNDTLIHALGRPLGEWVSFESLVQQRLLDPLDDIVGDADATFNDLASALTTTVTESRWTGLAQDIVVAAQESIDGDDAIAMRVPVRQSGTVAEADVDFSAIRAELPGLDFDALADVELVWRAEMELGIGFDLDDNLDVAERLFFEPGTLELSLGAMLEDGEIALHAGLFELEIDGGELRLVSELSVDWATPPGDGRFTLDAMRTGLDLDVDEAAFDGSFDLDVPMALSIGGFSLPEGAHLGLTADDPFDPASYSFTSTDIGELGPLTRVDTGALLNFTDHLANTLSRFNASGILDHALPLATDRSLADVLDLGESLRASLIDPLVDEDGLPTFDTLEEMAEQLVTRFGLEDEFPDPADWLNAQYDPAAEDLSFDISWAHAFDPDTVRFALEADAGPLGELTSATLIDVLAFVEGGLTFNIGLDERELRLEADGTGPADGVLSDDATFTVTLDGHDPVDVTVDASVTQGNGSFEDLVDDVNAALTAEGLDDQLTAQRADSEDRLVFVTDDAASLFVEADDADPAVTELGLAAFASAGATRSELVTIDNAHINANVEIDVADLDAWASIGLLDIGIENGEGSLTATVDGLLKHPGDPAGLDDPQDASPVSLIELRDHAVSDPQAVFTGPNFEGEASLVMPVFADSALLDDDAPGDPRVVLDWADITEFDPAEADGPQFTFEDMDALLAFEELGFDDVVSLLADFADFLSDEAAGFSFLDHSIPVIDRSVNDLLDLAERFTERVETLEDEAVNSLDELAQTLNDALELPEDTVALALDEDGLLRIDFAFERVVAHQLDLDLDLMTLAEGVSGLENLPSLANVGGAARVDVDVTGGLHFSAGFDMEANSPAPVVLADTGIDFDVTLTAEDIDAEVTLGPLALEIVGGSAGLAADTDGDEPMLRLGLDDDEPHYTVAELANQLALDAAPVTVEATLPLSFPGFLDPADDLIELTVDNLFTDEPDVTLTGPDLEHVLGEFDLTRNLGAIIDGLDALLATVQAALASDVLDRDLPLVGSNLSEGADFIDTIRTEVIAELQDRLEPGDDAVDLAEEALLAALGDDGLGILDENDITIIEQADEITFTLDLDATVNVFTADVGFDIGIPALGMDIDGTVDVDMGLEWQLGFGIDRDEGFFLATGPDHDLDVGLHASIDGFDAAGSLAFLRATASDSTSDPSGLNAALSVGLEDTDGTGRLSFDNRHELSQRVDATLDGSAQANLDLTLDFGADAAFPSLEATLHAGWSFGGDDMAPEPPELGFENVRLDGGAFVERFVAPVLERIEQAIAPVQPIIDVLTTPIPGIDDVDPRSGDTTLLRLAHDFGFADTAFIQAAAQVVGLIDTIGDVADSITAGSMIDLGEFTINPDEHIHEQSDLLGIDLTDQDLNLAADPLGAFEDLSTEAEEFIADVQGGVIADDGAGLQFPLLSDPIQGLRLLLGQDVDLFTYDMPSLGLDLSFSRTFGPFLTLGPASLSAEFEAELEAVVDFEVGYDTRGFRQWRETGDIGNVINGFYAVTEGDASDTPATRAAITGSIFGGPVFDAGVARAGVRGGLSANLEATLRDPAEVGRVYTDQVLRRAEFGAVCALEATGAVTAGIEAYLTIGRGPLSTTVEFDVLETELLSFETDDSHCYPNRFAPNGTLDDAADLGAGPGIHVQGDSISDANDIDWYRFELLEADTVDVRADFIDPMGNTLEVYDADGNLIKRTSGQTEDLVITLDDADPGDYYVQLYGEQNRYDLSVIPGQASDTTVYYVNPITTDNSPDNQAFNAAADLYRTLAPGDDAHEGVSPHAPVATLTGIDASALEPGDVIVFDTGAHTTPIVLDSDYDGISFLGSPGGATFSGGADPAWLLEGTTDATLQGLELTGGAEVRLDDGAEGNDIRGNTGGRVVLADGADNRVFENTDTGVSVEAGAHGEVFDNLIRGVSEAIIIDADADPDTRVFENEVAEADTGIRNDSAAIALIDNTVRDSTRGLTGAGLLGSDSADTPNLLHDNTTGVHVDVGSAVVQHNEIHDNATGIEAASSEPATIVDNHVFENQVGIAGGPIIGGDDWTRPNLVHDNDLGIDAATDAEVRFNRLRGNATGIAAGSGSLIRNNLVYQSEDIDIAVHNRQDVRIVNNTIHAIGDGGVESDHYDAGNSGNNGNGDDEVIRRGISVAEGSALITLRNNIIHTEDGYGLWVDPDSQSGFDSDYNNLFATGDGSIVWYQKSFDDLYDWQVEANQDNASIGYTTLDPDRDAPLFRDVDNGDYRLTDIASTSINAGDPASDFSNEPGPNGDRVNLGAYGNTAEAAASPESYILLRYPEFHVDWQADHGRPILWDAHNVEGQVRLELHREGDGLVDEIATVEAADGQYIWSPQASGITGDSDERYRVRVVDASDESVAVESREAFAVPSATGDYYVADNDAADNRNPGTSPDAPKASLLAMIRNYRLGPGDTVHVESGDYLHVRSVTLEGRHGGVHILGPDESEAPAWIDRGDASTGASVFEIDGAGFVTLENLHVTGGQRGLHLPDNAGSNGLHALNNTFTGHAQEALRVGSGNEDVRFEGNRVFDNAGVGIRLDGEATTAIGNEIHDNAGAGVWLDGRDHHIAGNVVELNDGAGVAFSSGGDAGRGSTVSENLIRENQGLGIDATGLAGRPQNVVIAGNEVIGHDAGGMLIDGSNALLEYNRIHGNGQFGIQLDHSSAVARGNEVYANPIGIDVLAADRLENNLLYANTDRGVRIGDAAFNVALVNNTVYQPQGDAVELTEAAQNVSLRHNILVVESGHALRVEIDSQAGFDSDDNLFHIADAGAAVGDWQGERADLAAWQSATFHDANSIEADPLFVNLEGDDPAAWDFHLQSEEGSYHGGALAPVFDEASGEMVWSEGELTVDANHSPAIAAGDPAFDTGDEPAPGGAINLGAFGGTAQASHGQSGFIDVSTPDDGAVWLADRTFSITWQSDDLEQIVTIEIFAVGEDDPVAVLEADPTPDDVDGGAWSWAIPDDIDPGDYELRVERADGVSDESDVFAIHEPADAFYVAPDGSDADDGLSASAPMASLNALLARYPIGAGDTIHVAAGDYELTRTIELASAHSGLTLRGDANADTVLDRANPHRPVIELIGAADVTIEHLHLTGGGVGLDLRADDVVVRDNQIFENAVAGVRFGPDATNATLEDNRVFENDGVGLHLNGESHLVTNSEIHENVGSGVHVDGRDHEVIGNVIAENFGTGVSFSSSGDAGRGTLVSENLIRDNMGNGIAATGTAGSPQNVVIAHNEVRNQPLSGITVNGSNALIEHNRVTGHSGNNGAIRLNSDSAVARANEVYANQYGIIVVSASQVANNLVYGNTQIGIFVEDSGGVDIDHNTVHQNFGHGIWLDRQSADVVLRHNILSMQSGHALRVEADSQSGFDSDYNLFHVGSGAVGAWQGDRADLAAWQAATLNDAHSLEADPLFVNVAGGDPTQWDLHLQSEEGSFHGGALAPVWDEAEGEMVMPEGDWNADGAHSPAIARGAAGFDIGDEPEPHGGRVNLGAFGGTEQASMSLPAFLELTTPMDGAVWLADRTFAIEWRTHDDGGTVTLELWEPGGSDPAQVIADDAANTGAFDWAIPEDIDPGAYELRIEREDDGLTDTSATFTVHEPVSDFYVNDGNVLADGLTSAAGDTANHGLSDDAPVSSINALLARYPLGAGDTIHVDGGTYELTQTIALDASHAGLTIRGHDDVDTDSVLDRANPHRPVLEVAGASGVTLEHLHLTGGARGLHVPDGAGSDDLMMRHSTIFGNAQDGAWISGGSENVRFEDNRVFDNAGRGVHLDGEGITVAGNEIHENVGSGVYVDGRDHEIIGNVIYLNFGSGVQFNTSAGSDSGRGSTVSENLIYENTVRGIDITGFSPPQDVVMTRNEVRDHAEGGIATESANALVSYNRVQGNDEFGIRLDHDGTVARGNEIYLNPVGLDVLGAERVENNLLYANAEGGIVVTSGAIALHNNTVHQAEGDALDISGGIADVTLRHNILVVQDGYALRVAPDSQRGFDSDYNLFHIDGPDALLGDWEGDRADLAAWQQATFDERNSLAADPHFVNVEGADPAAWDFHLQSEEGSFHGGALAPVWDEAEGEMVQPEGDWVADDDHSPAIARGDMALGTGDEPEPNGGLMNLGAFGGTEQASLAIPGEDEFITLATPTGGELWRADRTFTITWRSHDFDGTVALELREQGESEPAFVIAEDAENTGAFDWAIPADIDAGEYLLRIEREDGFTDVTTDPITIHEPVEDFYVNDGSVLADGLTTAAGDDAHDGLSPDAPVTSIATLLVRYNLGEGDTIHVDAGEYELTTPIHLGSAHAGLTIRGHVDPADPETRTLIDRSNPHRPVFEILGAAGVTLEHLHLTGGSRGIEVPHEAQSHDLVLRGNVIYGMQGEAIYIGEGNEGAWIADNEVRDNGSNGIHMDGAVAVISGNEVRGNDGAGINVGGAAEDVQIRDNRVQQQGQNGIVVSSFADEVLIEANLVQEQTQGTGILVGTDDAVVRGNVVSASERGIVLNGNALAEANRVYDQTGAGIVLSSGDAAAEANVVYGNRVGIEVGGASWVANNVVYANSERGVLVAGASDVAVVNNTVYQIAGEALRVAEGAEDISAHNNILIVQAGHALRVDADSQDGFDADYNLFHPDGANAHAGHWDGVARADLGDWQAASDADANALAANPHLFDPSGPDNALGVEIMEGMVAPAGLHDAPGFRVLEAGLAYHGGLDDRFDLADGSPAIDRAHTWAAPRFDRHGLDRIDDPDTDNQGGDRYVVHQLGASLFNDVGSAQGWQGNNSTWELELPFAFPFFGETYDEVTVSSNGFLDFDSNGADPDNTTDGLIHHRRIAPLWTDLSTSAGDIYVDAQDGHVTIRWEAQSQASQESVNVAVVLFEDGTIRFDYGSGNNDLDGPTVGLSMGNGHWYEIAAYDGAADLANAPSLEFRLEPGIVDIGAHEFQIPATDPRNVIENPSFVGATLGHWDAGGDGTVETVSSFGQFWARLIAGSATTLSQQITVPDDPSILTFQYLFEHAGGELIVTLNGQELDTLEAPGTLADDPSEYTIEIDDPDLLGEDAWLEFAFVGASGESVLLSDVDLPDESADPDDPTPPGVDGDTVVIGADAYRFVRYTDPSGTLVTVRLSGGEAQIGFDNDVTIVEASGGAFIDQPVSVAHITLSDTSARDSLLVAGRGGDHRVHIGSITSDDALRGIIAPQTVLDGAGIDVANSLYALHLLEVVDADVRVDGELAVAQMRHWDGGSLEADAIHTLRVTGGAGLAGDFNADLTLHGLEDSARFTLTHAVVRGDVGGSDGDVLTWDIAGEVNRIVVFGDVEHANWTIDGNTRRVLMGGGADDWSLTVTGDLLVLAAHEMGEANVAAEGHIVRIAVHGWDAGTIEATTLQVLGSRGDFGAELTLAGADDDSNGGYNPRFTLNRLVIVGDVNAQANGSAGDELQWDITGDVNRILVVGNVTEVDWAIDGQAGGIIVRGDADEWFVHVTGDLPVLAAHEIGHASVGADHLIRVLAHGWETGAIEATTLHTLVSHGDFGVSLDVEERAHRVVAHGDFVGSIEADSLGALSVGQDLRQAQITLRADDAEQQVLDRLRVGRIIGDTHIDAAGSVGEVAAGAMHNSRLLVGLHDADAPVSTLPQTEAEFDSHFDALAHLRSVLLGGVADEPFALSGSNVVAGEIRQAVVRGEVEVDNADEPFGFYAHDPAGRYVGPAEADDYVARIL